MFVKEPVRTPQAVHGKGTTLLIAEPSASFLLPVSGNALEAARPARARLDRKASISGPALCAEASLRLLLLFTLPLAVLLPITEAMWIAFFAAVTA